MDFKDWYNEAYSLAEDRGFTDDQIDVFFYDLCDHYQKGLTPEEAVDIEF